ncbi:hypothetical protein [Streptacidiphilus rugosus]|nr:hypothetical protein [Streptacidiphilus rugosus]
MSDALNDINENGTEDDAHGRHRGHVSEDEAQDGSAHGRHRRSE